MGFPFLNGSPMGDPCNTLGPMQYFENHIFSNYDMGGVPKKVSQTFLFQNLATKKPSV
jgi:hypothetical protein